MTAEDARLAALADLIRRRMAALMVEQAKYTAVIAELERILAEIEQRPTEEEETPA